MFFFFKQETAYEKLRSLVGSEMCIRDSDERDPGGQLHTNFRLSDEGEYLALSAPDGSLVNEFTFPAQREDVGYGVGQVETLRTFVNGNSVSYTHLTLPTIYPV